MATEIYRSHRKLNTPIKVSIVMPVYNAESFLNETMDCLLGQTLKEFELICVDDGSSDSSLTILQAYALKDSRIHVIHQENSGAGTARNHGMQYAHGEYLMFLDCDDLFEPTMVEKLYKAAIKVDADVAVCRTDQFDDCLKEHFPCEWTIRKDLLPPNKVFKSTDVTKDFFLLFVWWPWDKIYKRSHIERQNLQYQELRTTNDLFFVCAAVLTANKITYVDDLLVHQRCGRTSSLSMTREKSWDCYLKALFKLRKFLKEQNIYNRFERDFINYAADFSLWHLNTIPGPSYSLLYQALRDKWLEEFKIVGKSESYFYEINRFLGTQYIMTHTVNEALTEKVFQLEVELDNTKREVAKQRNDALFWQRELKNVKSGLSFRIGRVITYIPRKIRNSLKW